MSHIGFALFFYVNILNSKNKSIAQFYLRTLDEKIIKIVGYDGIADFCYRNLYIGKNIFIYGVLTIFGVEVKNVIILF